MRQFQSRTEPSGDGAAPSALTAGTGRTTETVGGSLPRYLRFDTSQFSLISEPRPVTLHSGRWPENYQWRELHTAMITHICRKIGYGNALESADERTEAPSNPALW